MTLMKDDLGLITGMTMATTNDNGAPIPLTVPTVSAAEVSKRLRQPPRTFEQMLAVMFTVVIVWVANTKHFRPILREKDYR